MINDHKINYWLGQSEYFWWSMMKINLSQFPKLEAKLLFQKGLHLHVHVTRGLAEVQLYHWSYTPKTYLPIRAMICKHVEISLQSTITLVSKNPAPPLQLQI